MAKWWQGLQGCPGEPRAEHSDQTLDCSVYCEAGAASRAARLDRKQRAAGRKQAGMTAAGGPILKLCGMKGVGHDLNTPYHGYPFDVAW